MQEEESTGLPICTFFRLEGNCGETGGGQLLSRFIEVDAITYNTLHGVVS